MAKLVFCLTLVMAIGCASQPKPQPNSRAHVAFTSVTPPNGATVNASVAIDAEISYEIFDFKPGTRYLLSAQFDTADGHHTSHPNWPNDVVTLTAASGSVRVIYKLADAWNSTAIARNPMKVHFTIMKMTSPRAGDPLGQTETLSYMTEVH
jgi:hypothetical protein